MKLRPPRPPGAEVCIFIAFCKIRKTGETTQNEPPPGTSAHPPGDPQKDTLGSVSHYKNRGFGAPRARLGPITREIPWEIGLARSPPPFGGPGKPKKQGNHSLKAKHPQKTPRRAAKIPPMFVVLGFYAHSDPPIWRGEESTHEEAYAPKQFPDLYVPSISSKFRACMIDFWKIIWPPGRESLVFHGEKQNRAMPRKRPGWRGCAWPSGVEKTQISLCFSMKLRSWGGRCETAFHYFSR